MADVAELNKLTKAQLLSFKEKYGLDAALSAPVYPADTKETIVTALSAVATDEQLAEYNVFLADPANAGSEEEAAAEADRLAAEEAAGTPPADPNAELDQTNGAGVEKADPATEDDKQDATGADVKVGDDVEYPYDEAESGYRIGRVTAVSDDTMTVVWVDGSQREFSRDRLRLV